MEMGSAASVASSQSAVASRTMDDATWTLPALTYMLKVKSADLEFWDQQYGSGPSPCVCMRADSRLGVFHLRSTEGQYKLNFSAAQRWCEAEGASLATYTQLSYAQQVSECISSPKFLFC